MLIQSANKIQTGIFVTFSGNCRKALTFYQTCFGGDLYFDDFDKKVEDYTEVPVVSGSLISDQIIIHGSDLVHEEGRKIGNYISIFLPCENTMKRKLLVEKLAYQPNALSYINDEELTLIEITDTFEVRWVLACDRK